MIEGLGQNREIVRQPGSRAAAGPGAPRVSFKDVLSGVVRDELKVSAHAQARLQSSRINLTQDDMARLSRAVDRAAAKGARESLILMDNIAFVVSIKNRTVITAVSPERLKENVFTNIDSAVIT